MYLRIPPLLLLFVILIGCGEDGLIDPHGDVEIPPPPSDGFLAVDFPTNTGSAWTYANTATGQEFTLRIEGTRDISGFTHRQMTISELQPPLPNGVNRDAIDHLTANALYFRLDSDFFDFPLPISSTYFMKTPRAFIESAFDAYIPFLDNPVIHQKHFPERLIWDFPLQVGKRWTVFNKTTPRARHVVRRVLDANVPITVPTGRYDAYLVEEEILGLSQVEAVSEVGDPPQIVLARYKPARYWVVPNVGVVKYQYDFLTPIMTDTQGIVNLLRSVTWELITAELPEADAR
jgi:hypothetical protein